MGLYQHPHHVTASLIQAVHVGLEFTFTVLGYLSNEPKGFHLFVDQITLAILLQQMLLHQHYCWSEVCGGGTPFSEHL